MSDILTRDRIVAEFSEMMGTKARGLLSPFGDELILSVKSDGLNCACRVELSGIDLTLTLEEFRERYLEPMAYNIRETIAEQRSPK